MVANLARTQAWSSSASTHARSGAPGHDGRRSARRAGIDWEGRITALAECDLRLTSSGAGVLTPGTSPGPGRVNVPFGMTPEVLLLELHGAAAVLTQRIRCTVQESGVAGCVEMLQLAEQVLLGKILGVHT
jgi:hypothetical protein